MDREILFATEAFIAFFAGFFGWTAIVAQKANKVERDDVIGMLEADRIATHIENDRVAQEQVEQGQC